MKGNIHMYSMKDYAAVLKDIKTARTYATEAQVNIPTISLNEAKAMRKALKKDGYSKVAVEKNRLGQYEVIVL